MYRRLVVFALLAVCLVIGFHASVAAKPRYFVLRCDTESAGQLIMVQGDAFKNLGQAVSHCVSFWNGTVVSVEK